MTDNNNTFSTAINARIDAAIKADKMSESNRDKLRNFAKECNNSEKLVAFLANAQVDVRVFENDVYEIDKLRNLSRFAVDEIAARDFNEMNRCVFLTALAFERADIAFTREDATHACSSHYKIKDAKKRALTAQNAKQVADSTVASQHRSSLKALEALNILRSINKSEFRMNLQNDATIKLAAKFNIDLSKAAE
ncbi:hypothetical protein [Shinella zoogloeoides]|uniref:hypothetical protein n=1 Tax=Shinella zoogloeoides TaxID=352475 RepID=UPI00273D9302|nr:hypothetical protein [Shinella zoogloeoides]WLR90971.1 hypothetical protein Q9316_00035 [Shinella zoogloeoides]